MFLDTYQSLMDKERPAFESAYQDFKNKNIIKRSWMALDTCENLKTKKFTKRRKFRQLSKRKQNIGSIPR